MSILVAGLALFVAVHFITVITPLRSRLICRFGESPYKVAFTLISVFSIGLIIWGKSTAAFMPLYEPPLWGRHGAWLMMLIAFILLASTQGPSALRSFLKHPMLLGVAVWGAGHLLANGDLASVVLFGGMAVFSILMIILLFMRDGVKTGARYSWRSTIIQSMVGALIYLLVMYAHPFVFGVAVI